MSVNVSSATGARAGRDAAPVPPEAGPQPAAPKETGWPDPLPQGIAAPIRGLLAGGREIQALMAEHVVTHGLPDRLGPKGSAGAADGRLASGSPRPAGPSRPAEARSRAVGWQQPAPVRASLAFAARRNATDDVQRQRNDNEREASRIHETPPSVAGAWAGIVRGPRALTRVAAPAGEGPGQARSNGAAALGQPGSRSGVLPSLP